MSQNKPFEEQTLVEKLRIRAQIRRQAKGRKSVEEGAPDRLSALLEEAATEITQLEARVGRYAQMIIDLEDESRRQRVEIKQLKGLK